MGLELGFYSERMHLLKMFRFRGRIIMGWHSIDCFMPHVGHLQESITVH